MTVKTYYCVTTTIYDNGRAAAAITDTIEADAKPESRFTETRSRDIYTDYFESLKEAKQFVKEAKET
jgi:hypothetical protein